VPGSHAGARASRAGGRPEDGQLARVRRTGALERVDRSTRSTGATSIAPLRRLSPPNTGRVSRASGRRRRSGSLTPRGGSGRSRARSWRGSIRAPGSTRSTRRRPSGPRRLTNAVRRGGGPSRGRRRLVHRAAAAARLAAPLRDLPLSLITWVGRRTETRRVIRTVAHLAAARSSTRERTS
jgi:hypothetical protein